MRDYQFDAFVECVRNRRILLLSPTASGKSLIIYALIRYYLLSSAFEDRNNSLHSSDLTLIKNDLFSFSSA